MAKKSRTGQSATANSMRNRSRSRRRKIEEPITHVALILDASSSMVSMGDAPRQMFNEQLKELKSMAKEQGVFVTVLTFSTFVDEPIHDGVAASKVRSILRGQYRPQGQTALYDAIGQQIRRFEDEVEHDEEDNVAFLFLIITDGEENNSVQFKSTLPQMIQRKQREENWTFTILGSEDINLHQMSRVLNISQENISSFMPTREGMFRGGEVLTSAVQTYGASRAIGCKVSKSFYGADSIRGESESETGRALKKKRKR